ncbi:OpgC [Granulibacter bethesdensis]|uniref:OpgC n=1 Tax=Granulibacter bethesdensis TaxID=364410 RepID=A0AAN0RF31_9PROT|nr:OpgC [Granulibacter bethesdensis]
MSLGDVAIPCRNCPGYPMAVARGRHPGTGQWAGTGQWDGLLRLVKFFLLCEPFAWVSVQ